jgi:ketosteroid isomerase-like protein
VLVGRDAELAVLDALVTQTAAGVGGAATAPTSGKSIAMDIHHWWRFRDGKICFYRGTEDTAQTQAVLSAD